MVNLVTCEIIRPPQPRLGHLNTSILSTTILDGKFDGQTDDYPHHVQIHF